MPAANLRSGLAVALLCVAGCPSDEARPPTAGTGPSSGGSTGDPTTAGSGGTSDGPNTATTDPSGDETGSTTGAGEETGDPSCGGVACDANASCIDEACVCDEGWVGDGTSCADADGCEDAPCFEGVTCTDEPAPGTGYTCGACPTGYEGDGMSCTDADGCVDTPCFEGVTCTDAPAPEEGFSCGPCPAGYEGDGQTCVDIDGCADTPCFMDVVCTDVPAPGDGFTCGPCPDGTIGDGIDCVAVMDYEVGDLSNSTVQGPYFRGNGYVADADGTLVDFEVYLGNAGGCNLDFYVFEAASPGGALTQVWRNTVVGSGTGYQASGPVDLPVTSGTYYALGVGWNCSLTYYWNNSGASAGADAGVGVVNNNRWDNGYPGASDLYTPPNIGGTSTTYRQRISWSEG